MGGTQCIVLSSVVSKRLDVILLLLRALYILFKDVSARWQRYFECTGSTLFALKFCSLRWLNNSIVAKKVLDMLPDLLKYLQAVYKNRNQARKCESFNTVKTACNDPLLPVQLQFFKSLAEEIEPFFDQVSV